MKIVQLTEFKKGRAFTKNICELSTGIWDNAAARQACGMLTTIFHECVTKCGYQFRNTVLDQ